MTIEQKKTFVDSCPRKVYNMDSMTQAIDIEELNREKCNLCEECSKYAIDEGHPGVVELAEQQEKFIFTVESTGALSPT